VNRERAPMLTQRFGEADESCPGALDVFLHFGFPEGEFRVVVREVPPTLQRDERFGEVPYREGNSRMAGCLQRRFVWPCTSAR